MPPKRKAGRPPGSKNKKGRKTCKKIAVKKKPVLIIRVEKEEVERSLNGDECSTNDENLCGVCRKVFNSKAELETHHIRCRALEIVSDYFPKVNKVFHKVDIYRLHIVVT